MSLWSVELQTLQLHPIIGTPCDVPVPRKVKLSIAFFFCNLLLSTTNVQKNGPFAMNEPSILFCSAENYSVAFSSFFIIENITIPEITHRAISTVHTPHKGSLFHNRPGIETR